MSEFEKPSLGDQENVLGINDFFSIQGVREVHERIGQAFNLGKRLKDQGHPYGLLILSAPLLTGSKYIGGHEIPGWIWMGSSVVYSTSLLAAPEFLALNLAALVVSGRPPVEQSSLLGVSSLSVGKSEDSDDRGKALAYYSMGAALLAAALGVLPREELTRQYLQFLQSSPYPQMRNLTQGMDGVGEAFLAAVSLAGRESLQKQKREIDLTPKISETSVSIGSFSTKAARYNGENPYTIIHDGIEVATINPGQTILIPHVNRNAAAYAQMGTLERMRAIKRDFIQLSQLLNNPEKFNLAEDKVEIVRRLKDSPMIGVSHLVRLLGKANVPTWGIDPLPGLLRKFHSIDSQLVSRSFGGEGTVSERDVGVVFISAVARQQIVV